LFCIIEKAVNLPLNKFAHHVSFLLWRAEGSTDTPQRSATPRIDASEASDKVVYFDKSVNRRKQILH